jgi:hypothetical protein
MLCGNFPSHSSLSITQNVHIRVRHGKIQEIGLVEYSDRIADALLHQCIGARYGTPDIAEALCNSESIRLSPLIATLSSHMGTGACVMKGSGEYTYDLASSPSQ